MKTNTNKILMKQKKSYTPPQLHFQSLEGVLMWVQGGTSPLGDTMPNPSPRKKGNTEVF